MADQNQERRDQERVARNYSQEPGPQIDPALREGPATSTRTWLVTGVIAAVVLAVMYGITSERNQAGTEPQITTGQNQTPSQSGGRGTSDAPANPTITTPAQKSGG